jgi:hypothetical protein
MRQPEFEKISAVLDRAEFALEELRKKAEKLHRKFDAAKTPKELFELKLEAAELNQQLQNIRGAVHAGRRAPISDWSTTKNNITGHAQGCPQSSSPILLWSP